ncbi:hypothetical protein CGRA01v4_04160 [Colletotrichum graminicola]|nr:hypothetical protein CGRA01v4_04160 [Colletotrichum graminicola]
MCQISLFALQRKHRRLGPGSGGPRSYIPTTYYTPYLRVRPRRSRQTDRQTRPCRPSLRLREAVCKHQIQWKANRSCHVCPPHQHPGYCPNKVGQINAHRWSNKCKQHRYQQCNLPGASHRIHVGRMEAGLTEDLFLLLAALMSWHMHGLFGGLSSYRLDHPTRALIETDLKT